MPSAVLAAPPAPVPPESPVEPRVNERLVVLVVAAVQFVNILDFMMVMPLGPDFALALGIPVSELGTVGGSYTIAAFASGLAGSFFLDRFDRRKALAVAILGLAAGTAAGGLATSLPTLLLARFAAGAFGGPATSIALSIVSDVIPPARRGRAMSTVMGAFAVASVLGVPAGLNLATWFGWRAPFFAVGAIALVINLVAFKLLPPLTLHLEAQKTLPRVRIRDVLRRPTVLLSYAMTAVIQIGGFMLIPQISGYVQENLGYPRDRVDLLYLVGGAASFVALPLIGRLVDRFGSFANGAVGAVVYAAAVYVGFVLVPPPIPVMALFVVFMIANNLRNVAYNALTSKVPGPAERARFMSVQSAVQHLSLSIGALISSRLLGVDADQKLTGMEATAVCSIALALLAPLLMWRLERVIAKRGPGSA